MKLSLELPTKYLATLSRLCDFDFCLAQVALEDVEYCSFYKTQGEAGRMVILDNGFHEMGRPLSVPELLVAVAEVKPSFVIAPDWLGKPVETYEAFCKMKTALEPNAARLAVVLCGNDEQERVNFFTNTAPYAQMLCLPFRENRRAWFQELFNSYPDPHSWPDFIHLLGMNEFQEANWWRGLRLRLTAINPEWAKKQFSIDTSKPIKWGMECIDLDFNTSPRGAKTKSSELHKIQAISPKQMDTILRNIAYLRRFV